MSTWGLLAASMGLVWLCLGNGWNRLAGLLGVVAMLLAIITNRHPDILLSESGRLLAIQDPAGQLVVSSNRTERRIRDTWLRRQAQSKSASFEQTAQQMNWLSCTYADSCQVQIKNRKVVFDLGRIPSEIACGSNDVTIVPQRRIACSGPGDSSGHVVIDLRNVTDTGAIAIFIDAHALRIDTTAQSVGKRPWSAFGPSSVETEEADSAGESAVEGDQ
jgi:hypothetical protein